jgi:hypothetical protein
LQTKSLIVHQAPNALPSRTELDGRKEFAQGTERSSDILQLSSKAGMGFATSTENVTKGEEKGW